MKKVFIFAIAACLVTAISAQNKRYGIESAVVKSKSAVMGQEVVTTIYFSDYGETEATETAMKIMGRNIKTFTMRKDGYFYTANLPSKEGTKIKVSSIEDYKNVNFQELTNEIKEKFGIEEKGSEQILGRDCKKYDLTYSNQGQEFNATVWIWEGLSLKTELAVMGAVVVTEATEITEGNVPKEKLDLPAGVKFKEQ
jgi:inorganic pyrophosphatase/exopolyphosphatase